MSIPPEQTLPPPPNATSQTVERIREIIVGRQLHRLEQRVNQLEAQPIAPKAHQHASASVDESWLERLLHHEARLEALQEQVTRLPGVTREMTEKSLAQFREETQRISALIQQKTSHFTNDVAPAVKQLEAKVGSWLGDWQHSFYNHLQERDHRLSEKLRQETAMLWESTEAQMTRLESRMMDHTAIEERFQRIALAARALAECASPTKPALHAS